MSETFLDPTGEEDGCIYRGPYNLQLRATTLAETVEAVQKNEIPPDFVMSFDREYICMMTRDELLQLHSEIAHLLGQV